MLKYAGASFLVLILCCPAGAAGSDCTTDFAPIVARGRLLAAYDLAARNAYRAIRAEGPLQGAINQSIARQTETEWSVVFGRLADNGDKFLIVYEATQRGASDAFDVKKNDPPVADTGFYFLASKAIATARTVFQPEDHPYNTFVLPADAGQMYVYFEPAITSKDSVPLGGDARYLVSADGTKIVEARRMHASIIEKSLPPQGTKAAGGFHTHLLSDSPEDSDVFYVLRQHPPMPEFVSTVHKCSYMISADGSIKLSK